MADISTMSNEDLLKIASSGDIRSKATDADIKSLTNQDLLRIASGGKSEDSGFLKQLESFSRGGVTSFGGENPREAGEALPTIGAIAGGGGGLPGSVLGATLGQAGRQGVRFLTGEQDKIDMRRIGTEAITTTALEAIFRAPAAVLFKKARASEEIKQGLGKVLLRQKIALAKLSDENPALRINTGRVLNKIDDVLKKVADTSGGQGALLRRWRKVFSESPTITMDKLMQFETRLGDAIDFGQETGGLKVVTEVKNSLLNSKLAGLRSSVSDIVDNVAVKAGFKDFKKLNESFSKLMKIVTKKKASKLNLLVEGGLAGVAAREAFDNALLGPAVPAALILAGDDAVRNNLFRMIEKTGVGRFMTLGAEEIFRQVENESQEFFKDKVHSSNNK